MLPNTPYFKNEFQQDLEEVNQVIAQQVKSGVVLIEQVGNYIIHSGGKRMRPLIAVLSGKVLGYTKPELYRQAAMVEFIHTSTLLHDDVVDESDKRRGRDTANNLFGNAAAVLVGDFLYTRAFQLMVGADSMKLMKIMADATNVIAAGEVMQLMNIGNVDLAEDAYLEVIKSKTAKLFEAAAQIGAVLANAPVEQETALKNYGMLLGTVFQIVDDILDYVGDADTIGKNLGDDLAEGKATLPLIYLMRQGTPAAAAAVKDALTNGRREKFAEIRDFVLNSNALDYCRSVTEKMAQDAVACLSVLPDNLYRQTVAEVVKQSVIRQY
ncbi:MAG: polyprenyl synthetase family protein [Neisseriaceae bacterium]|nr:polyprenyl synthetase family protein [Neisseriaceae bacterium]